MKLILISCFALLLFAGCSQKEPKEIDYKIQQENSQKAFKNL